MHGVFFVTCVITKFSNLIFTKNICSGIIYPYLDNVEVVEGVDFMAEIIKAYRQSMPAMRFVGKKYGDGDRVDGSFGPKWGEWFANNWFNAIEQSITEYIKEAYEDCGAYIGLMRWKEGEPFEYWIGMFTHEANPVPDGYEFIDFPKSELGVCWVYGKEPDIYCKEDKCAEKLGEEGCRVIRDGKGAWWFFERYCCPRFTTPDDKGNVILDICHFIE